MGRHSDGTKVFCALVLASATACATPPATPAVVPAPQLTQTAPPPVPPAERSKPLEGRWSLVLMLDPLSMRNLPPAEEAKGEVAFGTSSWWSNSDRFGRQHVDLKPFFGRLYAPPDGVDAFSAADTSMFSEASGGLVGDSVSIDFLPRIDHGGVSLWGRFWGDSARGTWRRRGLEGSGTFVMRRLSKDAVNVAAIPVPTSVAPTVVAAVDTAKAKPKPMTKAQRLAAARAERLAKAKARSDSIANAKAERLAKQKARDDSIATARAERLARQKATADSIATAKASAQALTRQLSNEAPRAATTVASAAPTPSARSSSPPPVAADSSAASSPGTAMRVSDAAPAPADPKAPVAIRVRLLDKSSKKYVATKYSLHVPDGRWMFGRLRTGDTGDGFGAATTGHPGRYEVEITDFMCGDKLWFLKDRILMPVEVKPGQPADVTIEADLANAAARPSFDNKAGEKCSAPIGAEK